MDWIKSGKQEQKLGVPQGSILSVTLFAIKINEIANAISNYIHKSLFVEDVQIAYSHQKIAEINSRLQETTDKVNNWATLDCFRFSAIKTVCMSFYNGCKPVVLPRPVVGDS